MGKTKKVKYKLIGIGGFGCAWVESLLDCPLGTLEYMVADDDASYLESSRVQNKIFINTDEDNFPDSAEKIKEDFEKFLKNAALLVIAVGLGGSVGSLIAPSLARIARNNGVATVVVATKPFSDEGTDRMNTFDNSLAELHKIGCATLVLPNDKAISQGFGDGRYENAMKQNEKYFKFALLCILEPFVGNCVVGFDKKNIAAIYGKGGSVSFGESFAYDKSVLNQTAIKAAQCSLTDGAVGGKTDVVIYLRCGSAIDLYEVDMAVTAVERQFDKNVRFYLSVLFDNLPKNAAQVSVLAI